MIYGLYMSRSRPSRHRVHGPPFAGVRGMAALASEGGGEGAGPRAETKGSPPRKRARGEKATFVTTSQKATAGSADHAHDLIGAPVATDNIPYRNAQTSNILFKCAREPANYSTAGPKSTITDWSSVFTNIPYDIPNHPSHSPVNVHSLLPLLTKYNNFETAEELAEGFTKGFRIGFQGKREFRPSKNLQSIKLYPGAAVSKISSEIELKRMSGPYRDPPF